MRSDCDTRRATCSCAERKHTAARMSVPSALCVWALLHAASAAPAYNAVCPHAPPASPSASQVDAAFRFPFGLPPTLVGDNPRDGLPDYFGPDAGRPNWNRILKELKSKHTDDEVGVFFCGPAPIAKAISEGCKKHSSSLEDRRAGRGTNFVFHKENF